MTNSGKDNTPDFRITRIPFEKVPQLSRTDTDYATQPGIFSEFVAGLPSLDAFSGAVKRRRKVETNRRLLVETISSQYDQIGEICQNADHLLNSDCFTVTTAHQPSLLTGPLYFIYKICSTINLARQLNAHFGDIQVVPVFVLGGEDHDFEEINHVKFFNKTFHWENEEDGPVGRMSLDSLQDVIGEVKSVLGEGAYASALSSIIEQSFVKDWSYGLGMQKFVVSLFSQTELIVLNMDDAGLKGLFTKVMEDELLSQSSVDIVHASQERIASLGYKPQAHVREINLFYLEPGARRRIELQDGNFAVVDSDTVFSKDEILAKLKSHPNSFSPNVILRPLYQETVLPNLAYIGGGGEIAYWLERMAQFEYFGIPFPLLIRRNSVLFLSKSSARQRIKLEIPVEKLFVDPEKEISAWVAGHSENEVDVSGEQERIDAALEDIVEKARQIDPTFARKVEAFKVKTLKDVEHMGKRLVREEKSRFEVKIKQIRKLYDRLFPDMGLQERHDNFIPFYLSYGDGLFTLLIEHLDPLKQGFVVIEEEV